MTAGKYIIILMLITASGCSSNKKNQETHEVPQIQSSKDLKDGIIGKHPATYIQLAAQLLNEGKIDEAVKWYYIGQMRFRAHLKANPTLDKSGDPALYASLKYVVGTPINEYAGGSPDTWVELIDQAINWNKNNPNNFTDKKKYPEIYAEIENNFQKFKSYVVENKEKIRKQRKENGLENR